MNDFNDLTTPQLIVEWTNRGATDPMRDALIEAIQDRVSYLYRELAEWEDEIERTNDVGVAETCEINLQHIEGDLNALAPIMREIHAAA